MQIKNGNETLKFVYAPSEPTGYGNVVYSKNNAITGWITVANETSTKNATYSHIYAKNYIAQQDIGRVAQIDYFINTLEEMDAPDKAFDNQLWISMVDHVVVHSKEDIRVVYRDGIEKNTVFLSNIIDV